jgi:[protein-PII] uridylyltransferase
VQRLWEAYPVPHAVLLAIGGYGRGELSPFSDIDLLILLPESICADTLEGPLSRFVSSLWDAGLDAGHSVRTLSECIALAKDDLTIATALLEARTLVGPGSLIAELQQRWHAEIDQAGFVQGKLLELQQRHRRYQDSPYALEPNVKESPGGLRDLQVIRWIALAMGLDGTWASLAKHGLLTQKEARQLALHQSVLHTFRAHLHLLAGRREDRLVFDLQNRMAEELGVSVSATQAGSATQGGHAGRGGRRPSEMLMQRYYRAAKLVSQVTSILLADLELTGNNNRVAAEARPISDDFQEVRGLLDLRHDQVFARRPTAILEAFLEMQQSSSRRGMTARTLRALWNHRDQIDQAYRDDPQHRALLLKMFQEPRGIVHALRIMNNLGILGRMLPVFRRIVGQMQHDLFHVYTVDQHILQVIRNLRRFTMTEHAHEFPLLTELMSEMNAPWKLYLAALFHDIAKGRGGDHSELGGHEVERFCRQFGLDSETTSLLIFLVQEHLTMSSIAQKQDLADPLVIAAFADKVKTVERLQSLYLLTVADVRGTSPKVWNAWKAKLLEELFRKTNQLLQARAKEHGTQTRSITSPLDQTREAKRQEAERILQLHGQSLESAHRLWKTLDVSYFLRQSAEEIAWHARQIKGSDQTGRPFVFARLAPAGEGFQVGVYLRDSAEVFARITAYFDAQSLPVLDARIHTTQNGYVLDVFLVDHQTFAGQAREMLSLIEAGLSQHLASHTPLPPPTPRGRLSRQSKHFPVPPTVALEPDARGQFFILSITAADRAGLLYSIAHCLTEHQIEIHTARVSTLGERAEDIFLIRGPELDRERFQVMLESDLLKVLDQTPN